MPSPEDYAKRLAKGSAIVFTALVISGLVGFLLRMFLARSLSVADYGLFYAVFSLLKFFALFCDMGLNWALVKYIPEFQVRGEYGAIRSSIIFVAFFQTILAFFFAMMLFIFSNQLALAFFKSETAALLLQILSIWLFAIVFYTLIHNVFQGFQNMPAYAGMELSWIVLVFFSA
ncbi:MAG: oligosaccharide flippase family protein, partial [Candidatus Hadarchaeum sp.]|uniref:oligosaccharide flippase family protein n=1 Tax=Candidatus Hadarchaeum sp. TaxID=2883567 RepID=UPI00317646C5